MAKHDAVPRQHRTVLLHEAVDALVHRPDGTYVDGTFGRGGHSRLILSRLSPEGRLLAIDRDPEAVAHATQGTPASPIHASRSTTPASPTTPP